MFTRKLDGVFLFVFLAALTYPVAAQQAPIHFVFLTYGAVAKQQGPFHLGGTGTSEGLNGFVSADLSQISGGQTMWSVANAGQNRSPLEGPSGSVSKLDLKAPGKAQREYHKGYELLMKKDFKGAIEHLAIAVSVYPDFVAAHNALGTAYLSLGQNDQARDQFAKAVSLDDHLPTSYINLGCAQLALKDYHSAQASVQKASSIAPLDLQLATALTYTQFMNQDYGAVLATAHQVHSRKHEGAAMVHYYAAAAFDGQNNLEEEQNELETLLKEDPKSPAADQARQALAQIKLEQLRRAAQKKQPPAPAVANPAEVKPSGPTPEQLAAQLQLAKQDAQEQKQIAEADVEPAPMCANCTTMASAGGPAAAGPAPSVERSRNSSFTLRSVVDEVAVFFAATDHGKSVTDLTREDVGLRDAQKSPAAITGFRNEAQLPLRLGIVIDTSESITSRFSFEQHAAINFLQKVLTDKDDLAFVVGVANSVLLVQDFTSDQQQMAHAINQLAPAGGTALWDAVGFAADKLAARTETQPVARMLVVISDGKDNSSSVTLKEAVASAERGEVFVYTVSTREAADSDDYTMTGERAVVGDRALKVLAEHSGGAAFVPGSVTGLNHGLDELQQVIRSRYLISYKPAAFKHDGQYRAIDITAQKSGHKLRVYARHGYYAGATSASETKF
jgi:Ca-activated chloride channel family protein